MNWGRIGTAVLAKLAASAPNSAGLRSYASHDTGCSRGGNCKPQTPKTKRRARNKKARSSRRINRRNGS